MYTQNYPHGHHPHYSPATSRQYIPYSPYNPTPFKFDPSIYYFIRLGNDPRKLLKRTNPGSMTPPIFTVTDFNESDALRFMFKFEPDASSNYLISNYTFGAKEYFYVSADNQPLSVSSSGEPFIVSQSSNDTFRLSQARIPYSYIGLDNADTANTPQVFARFSFRNFENIWYITTDPLTPLPPIFLPFPIVEGIYSIQNLVYYDGYRMLETAPQLDPAYGPLVMPKQAIFDQLWRLSFDFNRNLYRITNQYNYCLYIHYQFGEYSVRFRPYVDSTDSCYWYLNTVNDDTFNIINYQYPDKVIEMSAKRPLEFPHTVLNERSNAAAQRWIFTRRY